MIITGIIPARYGSTRFPGKPLAVIAGKPMIQRVYEQSSKSKLLHKVVVATDDKRIFNSVLDFGGTAVLTGKRHKTGTDRICEVIESLKTDIVVNIQGDEPFINPAVIDLAVKPLITDRKLNVTTVAVEMKNDVNNPNKVKVVFDKNFNALYFSRSVIPSGIRNAGNVRYYKHLGIYAYRTGYLLRFSKLTPTPLERAESLEQLRMIEYGEKIKIVITKHDSLSVDTAGDIKNILKILKTRGKRI
ncbi:MAG: 3-deoxy-manno-octulosonate cytidylyltransferase [Ignavibacteria bacterium]|nr:3-deoxy-manno-octulosonate cytidylyltransferase [Ignavibacteria bacterium]